MIKTNTRNLHEKYHARTKKQTKIIKKNNFTYRLLLRFIDKYLVRSNQAVLDVGCGAGSISFYLASEGQNVTGIDISSKAIAECNKSLKHLGLKKISFKRSFFPEESAFENKFDAVIFTEVIEHLVDDGLALKTINKLLKKDGLLFLSTPSINALHKLGLTKDFDKEVGHLRRYTSLQLKNLLKENGFKIIEATNTEGVLRNFLFVNPHAGKLVKYINFFASDIVTFLDNISLKLFGNSNYIVVAKKK